MPAEVDPRTHRNWKMEGARHIRNAYDPINDRELSWPLPSWDWPDQRDQVRYDKPVTWTWPLDNASFYYWYFDRLILGPILTPITEMIRHLTIISVGHFRFNYAVNFPFWYFIKLAALGFAFNFAANSTALLAEKLDRLTTPSSWSHGLNTIVKHGSPIYTGAGQTPNVTSETRKVIMQEFKRKPYHVPAHSKGSFFFPFLLESLKYSRHNTMQFVYGWYKVIPFFLMFPIIASAHSSNHPLVSASNWGLATALAPTYAMRWACKNTPR